MASKSNENFRIEAEIRGIKKETLAKLLSEDYDSEQALATLNDVHMKSMAITLGQRGILEAWKDCINPELRPVVKQKQLDPEQLEGVRERPYVHDEMDMEPCLRNLNIADHFRAEVDSHIQNQGIRGIDEVLQTILDEYKTSSINIAVIGRRGTGKSSLINCLRNLRSTDEGAKTGPTETTKEICPYPYPDCDKFILWDLPGVGTENFPRSSYLETVQFPKYDAYIIVCKDVTEDDIWIAQEVQAATKEFYFIRTKIDIDWHNAPDDGIYDEDMLLTRIRDEIRNTLEKAQLATDHIFLVSNRLYNQTRWDFPRLVNALTHHTPQKNQRTMAMSMMACTQEIINLKRDELDKRINTVATLAASMEDNIEYQNVVLTEIQEYTKCFGTTDVDLEKWRVNIHNLHPKLRAIKQALDNSLSALVATAKTMQFLCGGFNFFFDFFEFRNPFKTRLEAIQAQQGRVVASAMKETFSLKREVAEDVMTKALGKCHELAIGILKARQ